MDVRQQVRCQALTLFLQHGYAGASLREIAAAVGVTPAAVYYHYRTKDQLLDDLLDPLLTRTEAALTDLEHGPAAEPRVVLSTLFDTVFADRDAFRFANGDIAVQHHRTIGPRIAALGDRLARLVGCSAEPADRILVTAALGVLFRPIARHPDEPVDQLRDQLLDGALCVLGHEGAERP